MEVRELRRREVGDRGEHDLEVALVERRVVREQPELAVAAEHGRLPDLQVDVARAEFHGATEGRIQVHESADRQPPRAP